MKISTALLSFTALASAFPVYEVDHHDTRVVKLGPNEYKLIKEGDKLQMRADNIRFIDVTSKILVDDAVSLGLISNPDIPFFQKVMTVVSKQLTELIEPPAYQYPKKVSHKDAIKKLHSQIDIDGVSNNLANFTSFYTRYYKSESGRESSEWLFNKVKETVSPLKDAKVTKVPHDWKQFSIIATIPGEIEETVIVGAHQDSANLILPMITQAPGADDDGSGTVTILEALRLLADSGFKPYNTLEFHFYSAEEGGLLGSYDVFKQYRAENKTVYGLLQQDMTGSTKRTKENGIEEHFGLIADYTSKNLNDFIKLIVDEYNDIPYHESACGYACSDHASALEFGYPSSFLIESEMKYTLEVIHSIWDTIDRIDFNHVKEHIKLTVAFAYELASAKIRETLE